MSDSITPSSSTPAAWITAVQRMLGRDRVEQLGSCPAVGDVARRHPRLAAELLQLGDELAAPSARAPLRLASSR